VQRFQFSLEQALRWRATRLDLENSELARLRQERHNIVQLRDRLRAESRSAAIAFQQNTRSTTGVELAMAAGYANGIANRIRRLDAQVAKCDGQIKRQTSAVVKADREKRLLERLKEERFDEWNYEMNRETENIAGELYLANRRHSSRR